MKVFKVYMPTHSDYVHVDDPHLQCPHLLAEIIEQHEGLEPGSVICEDRTHEFHSL